MFRIPVYILDSKQGPGDFDKWPFSIYADEGPVFTQWPNQIGSGRKKKDLLYPLVIWKPADDNIRAYDDWLNRILKARKPCIVLIDEVSSLGNGKPDSYPPGLAKILKQGRGLFMPTIVESQEAMGIPRQILGQTSHIVRMNLKNEDENSKLDKMLLPAPPITDDYGFNYYESSRGPLKGPWYYADLKDFFLAA